jgi:hypothetical protein
VKLPRPNFGKATKRHHKAHSHGTAKRWLNAVANLPTITETTGVIPTGTPPVRLSRKAHGGGRHRKHIDAA